MNRQTSSTVDIAIVFEPDGYVLEGAKLMGRQSAGNGFLRAAIAGLKDKTLFAYTPRKESAEIFSRTVSAIDPAARTGWIPANRLDQLAKWARSTCLIQALPKGQSCGFAWDLVGIPWLA